MHSPKSPRTPTFSNLFRRALTVGGTSSASKPRRGSTAASVDYTTIPPELWLKVFQHVPTFLLPSITLTCRSFRALAQPLLFLTIVTHPEEVPSLALRAAGSGKYRKRVLDRLGFFFSPQISAAVRVCKIAPPVPEADGASDDIIDYIFDTLPSLPNLRALECRDIRLTPRRLGLLQHLKLTSLTFETCFGDLGDFEAAPSVPLQKVTFKYPDSTISDGRASPWLLFLSPEHLEHLHATNTLILSTLVRSPQLFTRLRTLDLPVECLTSPHFIPALSRCPAVEHLSVHATKSLPLLSFESLPEGVLPLLKSYRGPHHFAGTLLRGRAAQHVDISAPGRPASLASSLLAISPSTLHSLSFGLTTSNIPPTLLASIHAKFRALRALAILDPALSSSDIKTLLAAVPAHDTLHELTLRIQGRDRFSLWVPPAELAADAASCFGKVRAALLKTYPALQRVELLYGSEGASSAWQLDACSGVFVQVAEAQ